MSASTYTTAKRPVYERLLTDITRGYCDILLCHSLSRLTRRPMELEQLLGLLARRDVGLFTVTVGKIDVATADGLSRGRMIGVMDAAEADRASERRRRQTSARAKSGKCHGGPVPFGYRYIGQPGSLTLEVDESAAALVREAAGRILGGSNLRAICRDWDSRGLVTNRGARWSHGSLLSILTRASTAGLTASGEQEFRADWAPLLGLEEWRRLRVILLDPSRRRGPRARVPRALNKLLVCGRCGKELVANAWGPHLMFACPTNALNGCGGVATQAEPLERFLVEEAAARVTTTWVRREWSMRKLDLDASCGLLSPADLFRQQRRQRVRSALVKELARYSGLSVPAQRSALRKVVAAVILGPSPHVRIGGLRWEERRKVLDTRTRIIWAELAD